MADERAGTDGGVEQAEGSLRARPGEPVVDSRTCGTAGCANAAMTMFDGLQPGGTFVLVADHDPLPIRYMLDAKRPSTAQWEPLTHGPELWQTRIKRVAATD